MEKERTEQTKGAGHTGGRWVRKQVVIFLKAVRRN